MPTPAAIVSIFFLVAVPAILFMVIWTVVTMARVLFPERPLPFDALRRRERARLLGRSVPVQARDIVEDLRRHPPRPVMPHRHPVAEGDDLPPPLFEDLWMRRN